MNPHQQLWDRIDELLRGGASIESVVRELGCSPTTVKKRRKLMRVGATAPPVGSDFREADDGTAVLSFHTGEPVKTLADAVRVADIDLSVWYVDRWECSQWTVPMKVEQGQDAGGRWRAAAPIQTQQYRVKVYLRRIVARAIHEALELVFEKFKAEAAPRWPKLPKERVSRAEPFLAVFGLFDVHFGKLAWAPETGEHYDLGIAESLFRNAVEDLISECGHRPISKILLPVGNDWFHIDNRSHTTTRGTSQDVDGRFSKVLAAGIRAAVWAVETLATIAPVQVELVPGNHDRTLAECLCHVIAARFHHSDRVSVGLEPRTRKYIRFGTNLIGLAHGDLVKPDKLPNLMPADAKRDWAETTCHEWLTGHGHRSQKWTALDTDTQHGTVVRQLRALTRTDLWHFDHGFCGQQPAAEIYFYGRDRGYAGHAVVPARA